MFKLTDVEINTEELAQKRVPKFNDGQVLYYYDIKHRKLYEVVCKTTFVKFLIDGGELSCTYEFALTNGTDLFSVSTSDDKKTTLPLYASINDYKSNFNVLSMVEFDGTPMFRWGEYSHLLLEKNLTPTTCEHDCFTLNSLFAYNMKDGSENYIANIYVNYLTLEFVFCAEKGSADVINLIARYEDNWYELESACYEIVTLVSMDGKEQHLPEC